MQTVPGPQQEYTPRVLYSNAQQYNYEHFFPALLIDDAKLIHEPEGPHPGEPAPDFLLKDTQGNEWHLQDLRGRPVILLMGSGTCPLTQGNLPGLQDLFAEFGSLCQWLMLYVREAHPGELLQAHRSYEKKRDQAEYFRETANIPWPILVDFLDGSVHKQYGLLPNPMYLIDADGRVAFVGEISHAPTLRRALNRLFEQNMRGPVLKGEDKTPHLLGPTAYGWAAIQRGGKGSLDDLTDKMLPLAVNLWLGNKLKFLLAPIARRSEPLPLAAKVAIGAAAGVAAWGLAQFVRRKVWGNETPGTSPNADRP